MLNLHSLAPLLAPWAVLPSAGAALATGRPEEPVAAPGFWRGLVTTLRENQELVAMIAVAVVLWVIALLMFRRSLRGDNNSRLGRQWLVVLAAVVAALSALLAAPIEAGTKAQIVQVLGVVLPAAIALSSTAILGNAIGGLVLQRTAIFRLGDFIEVGDHFGRVSERSLFNTEIQTADRDLITLPNLLLVTQPVKLIRPSGTIVSGYVSLGYDVSWTDVQAALVQAVERAKLIDPFVQVKELGDFSVVYRAAGLCEDVRSLLTVRSHLHTHMLDCLHEAGIEILSPNYVNMRGFEGDAPSTVPRRSALGPGALRDAPTDLIFDKADKAQALNTRRSELIELEKALTGAKSDEHEVLTAKRDRLKTHIEYLERLIEEEETE